MHDGCVRLLQAVLADTRTARAGQDWVVSQLTPTPVSVSPSALNVLSPSGSPELPPENVAATPPCLPSRKQADGSNDDDRQIAPALAGRDSLYLEKRVNAKSTRKISRLASDMMAEIVSSPRMEHELQRVLRSTLRAPAIQEAAADAVGGVGRLTAAAAADAVGRTLLPWRWLGS